MSLFHFNVTQVSRGKGQTAVASAAYRSGEKLHDSYYDEDPDYRKKGGVLYTEILLPEHVPKRLSDRETLWNEVESIEKHPQAQLAYSFNLALQNELTYEENLELARQFVLENFVAKGMIADLAIHDPDKGSDGIQNPHFHVLCPIRPINDDGTWGEKQHREYLLDENGERIRDKNGRFKFNAVATTDWGTAETLLSWRENWANLVNRKFEEKGIDSRVDHRSYEEQGIDLIPSIHEGPTVRAMEKKGIRTDKGDWNRLIKKTNSLLSVLKKNLKGLVDWITELRKEMQEEKETLRVAQLKTHTLYSLLSDYYEKRNAGAYSNKAKARNLSKQMKAINFLMENEIRTIEDLNAKVSSMYDEVSIACEKLKACDAEISAIKTALDMFEKYKTNKPVYDKLCTIKKKAISDKFKEDHHGELSLFYMARRKLDEMYPEGYPKAKDLKARLEALDGRHQILLSTYKKNKEEANSIYALKSAIEADYRKAIGEPEKKHERKSL